MNNKRYYSIDIIKFVCACLVVGVHTQVFTDVSQILSNVVTGSFGRMCVPFFSCVSGYFFIKAEIEGKKPLKHQILNLLKYYLIFSFIYLIWDYLNGNFSAMNFETIVSTIIKRFVLYGTYYHLWFFPCIILSLIIIHFAVKMHMTRPLMILSLVGYVFAALTYGWYEIGQSFIPGLNRLMEWFDFEYIRRFCGVTLPFSALGMFIIRTRTYWTAHFHGRILWIGWLVSIIANVIETSFVLNADISHGTTVTFSLLPVVYFTFMMGLRYPMANRDRVGKFCRNISILMYGLHPLILEIIEKVFEGKVWPTMLWGTTVILCIIIGWGIPVLLKELPV